MESMSVLCLRVMCTDKQTKHQFVKRNTETSNDEMRNSCSSSIFSGKKTTSNKAVFIFLPRASLLLSHCSSPNSSMSNAHTFKSPSSCLCIFIYVCHHPNEVSWKTPAMSNNLRQESEVLMLELSGDTFHTAH